jgi:CheY-like chemotaxis protein
VTGWHHERTLHSVLVVDDDAEFLDLATRILTGWGHAVIGKAGSVAEALAQANTEHRRLPVVLMFVRGQRSGP